ncbi:MAG: DUF6711 family protein [Enterocloster bolteae]
MAFEGWLLKINGIAFPTRLIAAESLKITPDQIMDLDPYRDANGELHRNALPHTATSIEFTTIALYLKDIEILNSFLPHDNRVRCEVEYWNPNTSSYVSGAFILLMYHMNFIWLMKRRRKFCTNQLR